MESKKRTAIFGGTFNPVHNEHIRLVKAAIKELDLDQLIVMPTYISPHKSTVAADAEDRFNMLNLAFANEKKVTVSNYEIKQGGKSYTYLTAEHFREITDGELFFICGGDMLIDFKTWRNPERILAACSLAVFGREDYAVDYEAERKYFKSKFGKEFVLLDYAGKKDSSTKIRTYVALGLGADGMTDEKVARYIEDKGLYKGDKYEQYVRERLPRKRLVHTAGVVTAAAEKAKELSLDADKVRISATLHDCAKYSDSGEFDGFVLPKDLPKPVVHAFLGAYVAEKVLGITDEEILDAIRYHTSGKANMSTLGKLIFVADMIEENRDYEGVEELRKLYITDFEVCFKECLKEEMIHLRHKTQKSSEIYFETVNAYKYYIEGKN